MMDGSSDASYSDSDEYFEVGGDLISPDQLQDRLAQSLFAFVSDYGGHAAQVEEVRRIPEHIDVIVLNVTTCISQDPKFEVLSEERLAVMFIDGAPAVVPLRTNFPPTPHSYGLPVGSALPGLMTICIDDRPWEDAKGDYSGAEIIRRIISWFGRVDSGEIDDVLQLPHTVFLPAEQTIMMSPDIQSRFDSPEGPPVFLQIRPLGENEKLLAIEDYELDDAEQPTDSVFTPFVGFTLGVRARNSGAMWHSPDQLGQLRNALSGAEQDLLDVLRERLTGLIAEAGDRIQRLYGSHLLIQLIVVNETHEGIEPMFLGTSATLGEIGVALGLLFESPGEVTHSFGRRLPVGDIDFNHAAGIRLMAANMCLWFEGEVAAVYAGHDKDWRNAIGKHVVALGTGSIGSQCLSSLVREGAFEEITLVDDDHLNPHNLARHTLRQPQLGMPKAEQVCNELREIRKDLAVTTISEKLESTQPSDALAFALKASDRVLDLTASVGASRTLCEIGERPRATSAFFNPSGTSVAVLQEDEDRVLDLATLEALYYAEIILNPSLHNHLRPGNQAVVSGGQCRSVTSRIPASRAAVLSGIAAGILGESLSAPAPAIIVATTGKGGATRVHRCDPAGERTLLEADGWTIGMADIVARRLQDLRQASLPDETGGILLGVVDHSRCRIEVAMGLGAPPDSAGTPASFERGVQDTLDSIADARERTMHQLSYVGEWHSHPRGARTVPSVIDAAQLLALRDELLAEQRPPVMVIVGDRGSNPVSIEVIECSALH
ncbi:MAG: hypothetical protein F4X97_09750 [Boseongicola sp. SB0662_bin_57]|nr:hypothetical protein [Boseongicola sp. SB0662_bin_57]